MLQTCDQENAEMANKDLGLFFRLKREIASTNFKKNEKLLHKVLNLLC